jgi:hypothetical protein
MWWQMCLKYVRFQVLTAASMKFRFVLSDVLPCKIIVERRFRGTCCLPHRPGYGGSTSVTSADNYFTRQYIPEYKYELRVSNSFSYIKSSLSYLIYFNTEKNFIKDISFL